MKKKLSENLDGLAKVTERQFDKLRKNKDKRWLLLIPLFVPLLSPALGILGIICLIIYIACAPQKDR